MKPVASLLFKKNKTAAAEKVQPELKKLDMWMHPSTMKVSEYVAARSEAEEENAANEALEAKLRELIVSEYSSRRRVRTGHPLSLTIQGHVTIIPSAHPAAMVATFWTADSDICYRDYTQTSGQQRAERQAPLRV